MKKGTSIAEKYCNKYKLGTCDLVALREEMESCSSSKAVFEDTLRYFVDGSILLDRVIVDEWQFWRDRD